MTVFEKKKKLQTLPWQALFELALSLEIDENSIKRESKERIIDVIFDTLEIEDDNIDELINDYVYGDRVTFTLWLLERSLTQEDKEAINDLEGKEETYLNNENYRNLKIVSVENIEDRFEVIYTYSKEYNYTNEEGKSDSVWELHRGCIWIGIDRPYVACISKHDRMTNCIISYLISSLLVKIIQVKPPKTALERCINVRAMSRITLQGVNGEKTVVSKSDGFTVEQEEEIQRIRNGRLDTSGTYIAELNENTCATIKYNLKKGSIGLYRHISATLLFEWTKDAINIIFEEIERLRGKQAEQIFTELGLQIKWGVFSNYNTSLNWILTQIIAAQLHEDIFRIQIPESIQGILNEEKFFIKSPRIYCEECDDYDIPICSECGEALRYNKEGRLYCMCEHKTQVICGEGHTQLKEDAWYFPTERLKMVIYKNYKAAFKEFTPKLNFCIMGDTFNLDVNYDNQNDEVEICFDSVNEFHFDPEIDLNHFKENAAKMKEKCGATCSYEKIQRCIASDTIVCLPKIFWRIIPGYRPQPHKGGEYGDISGQICVDDIYYELIGIIKKNTENTPSKQVSDMINKPLLSTSKEGEEIIRQFVEQGMTDRRCQVIAIIAPQYFDARLKGTLRYLARLEHKRVLFIELDEVAKILSIGNNDVQDDDI